MGKKVTVDVEKIPLLKPLFIQLGNYLNVVTKNEATSYRLF